ncbi:hypothetical protein K439DRAFT_951003 [Ramaria rubella]|nr:hypothetical protein K439DRAFT_951003 [Ramaria rubella]
MIYSRPVQDLWYRPYKFVDTFGMRRILKKGIMHLEFSCTVRNKKLYKITRLTRLQVTQVHKRIHEGLRGNNLPRTCLWKKPKHLQAWIPDQFLVEDCMITVPEPRLKSEQYHRLFGTGPVEQRDNCFEAAGDARLSDGCRIRVSVSKRMSTQRSPKRHGHNNRRMIWRIDWSFCLSIWHWRS